MPLLEPTPLGLIATVPASLALAMSWLVLRSRATATNRYLAAFFFSLGCWWLVNALGSMVTEPGVAYATALVGTLPVVAFHWNYLMFVGTLPTPNSAFLRTRVFRITITAAAVAFAGGVLLWPTIYQAGVVAGEGKLWVNRPGPAWLPFDMVSVSMLLIALAIAGSAYRRAPPGPVKRQMRYYLIAFVGYDGVLIVLLVLLLSYWAVNGIIAMNWFNLVLAPTTIWLVFWLAYGVLKTQLFDIDLKIKWTINRGTLVGVFLAVFFVATVVAENWLTSEFGFALGGVAAGLLLFALNPLQRFADRISDAAMPRVQDSDEYRTVRKRDVYLAALEGALVDGTINDRERDVLVRLQDQLGLSATDARALETRVTGGGVP